MNQAFFDQQLERNLDSSKHHAYLLISRSFADKSTPTALIEFLLKKLAKIELISSSSALQAQEFWDAYDRHPDVHRTDNERSTLRKDDVELFRDRSLYPPTFAARRFFLLERVERLNNQSANALLKTIEEPQAACVFVLTTAQPSVLPATIASRCQKIMIPAWDEKKSALSSIEIEDQKFLDSFFSQSQLSTPLNSALSETIHSTQVFNFDAKALNQMTVWADQASKRYSGQILRDVFVEKTSAALLSNNCSLSRAQAVVNIVSRWNDAEPFNPSGSLWLTRILLTLAN